MNYNYLPLRLIDKNGDYKVTQYEIWVQMDTPFVDCRWGKLGKLRFIEVISPIPVIQGERILCQLQRIYGKDDVNVLMHIISDPLNRYSPSIYLNTPESIGDTLCGISVKFNQEHNILSAHSNHFHQNIQFEKIDSTTHHIKNINLNNQLKLLGTMPHNTVFHITTDSDSDVCEQTQIVCDIMIYTNSKRHEIMSVHTPEVINVGLIYDDQNDLVPKRKLTKLKNKIKIMEEQLKKLTKENYVGEPGYGDHVFPYLLTHINRGGK